MTKNIFYDKINRHQLIVVFTRLINVLQHHRSNLKEPRNLKQKYFGLDCNMEFRNLFFSKQKQAVSQTTYLNRCIKVRLIPFIKSDHNKEKVLF